MPLSSAFNYQAYGLIFICPFEIPELPIAPSENSSADVTIEVGSHLAPEMVSEALKPDASIEEYLKFEANCCILFFTDVGRFTIREGQHILVEPIEGRGSSTWRLPLLGAVMAILLEQRGFFVLHAGAVDMGGFAAAFLGSKGQGKSTLNAALAVAGYPLLSDDVVALDWPNSASEPQKRASESFPLALPGFSQIKLVPDALRAVLQGDPTDWPAVAPELAEVDKRSFTAPLATGNMPLRHLFVLSSLTEAQLSEKGEGFWLRPLTSQQALVHIITHSYGVRFGDDYLKGERKKKHFTNCARVVRECQIWELARQRNLGLLPSIIEAIAHAVEAKPVLDAR